jgi:cytochrome c nitrite reductase small subunit
MHKHKLLFVFLVVLFVALVGVAGWKGIELSSTNQFCGSCHVMKPMYESSFHNVHRDPQVNCKDCHLPNDNVVKMLSYKAYSGIKDVVSNSMGPPDIIRTTATSKKIIQANCVRCHETTVQNIHNAGGNLCFECHRSIPHGQ